MNNLKSYIIMNKKTNLTTTLFIFITIIILIFLFFILQFKYEKYYQTVGKVIKENNIYQVALYIDPYKLNIFKNNNKIIIDNQEYTYKIDYIDNKYITFNELNNYLMLVLNISLKEKDKIINNVLNIKISESNKKIIYYLKDYLKKGVN